MIFNLFHISFWAKDDWWINIFEIDNCGDIDGSLFCLGYDEGLWLEIFFITLLINGRWKWRYFDE